MDNEYFSKTQLADILHIDRSVTSESFENQKSLPNTKMVSHQLTEHKNLKSS